jgi:Resolvase, N terminal domain/Helix-turn-helix domain of resolvase
VVWRLDRLGGSLRHLIETVSELEQRDVGFRSLTEGVDTTNAAGRMIVHIFGALAEFERSLIQGAHPRRPGGRRARGRHGGRPSSITPNKLAAAAAMGDQNRPMHAIAAALGVSRATLYRHLDVAAHSSGQQRDRDASARVAAATSFSGPWCSREATCRGVGTETSRIGRCARHPSVNPLAPRRAACQMPVLVCDDIASRGESGQCNWQSPAGPRSRDQR